MKATLSTRKQHYVSSFRKENAGLHKNYMVIDPRTGGKAIDCRIYWPAQTAYCALWVSGEKVYNQGTGRAGGGGYCKESAAVGDAIDSAGWDLDGNIHGVGETAIKEALLAIAKAIGVKKPIYVVAHP